MRDPMRDDEADRIEVLLSGYRPLPGAVDEVLDAEGVVRAHWRPLLAHLSSVADLASRFSVADRYLKNSGVSYRIYDGSKGQERPWPLAHVPLVISAQDWATIEAGVKQRAQLLQKVLADLYGRADLVRSGALPAGVVAGNPDFLRPLVGAIPGGGDHLLVYGADLGRGPDGKWWVLGDRTQAPSGMGYALENRFAMSQALPALHGELHIERLPAFFQALRDMLVQRSGREGTRIGLLSPGPANETYFEHAYLARYLGLLLVEGGDLTVQDNALYVRTVEGLKKLDGVLRRLDAGFADPLELHSWSRLGVPGLVEAVRSGSLTMANALGSGLVEAKAMMAFLPALAPHLLGEDLLLPNVATWWCGDEGARRFVQARLSDLALLPAFSPRFEGPGRTRSVLDAADSAGSRSLAGLLETRGSEIVAQEEVFLSTMPMWTGGGLVSRPFTLRVFALATSDGWQVMPGGLCRVAESADPRTLSMQQGGHSADVWVMAQHRKKILTQPRADSVPIRRHLGQLPSRAADNLFWLGRYLERAEITLRVVRALAQLSTDSAQSSAASGRLINLLRVWHAAGPESERPLAEDVIAHALWGEADSAAPALVESACRTASVIRDRLSPDASAALEDLRGLLASQESPPLERTERALRILAALSGLMHENMNRIAGWQFLQTGRRIERGLSTSTMIRMLAGASAGEGELDVLLQTTDSRIIYRSRYLMGTLRRPVLDLVTLDGANPRSILFQVKRLAEHFGAMPPSVEAGRLDAHHRTLALLRTRLEVSAAEDVDDALLKGIERQFLVLSDDVTARFFGQNEVFAEIEGLG